MSRSLSFSGEIGSVLRSIEFVQQIVAQQIGFDREQKIEKDLFPVFAVFADELHRSFLKRQHFDIANDFADIGDFLDQGVHLFLSIGNIEIFLKKENLQTLGSRSESRVANIVFELARPERL